MQSGVQGCIYAPGVLLFFISVMSWVSVSIISVSFSIYSFPFLFVNLLVPLLSGDKSTMWSPCPVIQALVSLSKYDSPSLGSLGIFGHINWDPHTLNKHNCLSRMFGPHLGTFVPPYHSYFASLPFGPRTAISSHFTFFSYISYANFPHIYGLWSPFLFPI